MPLCPILPGDLCSACPQASFTHPRPVPGDGPIDADIMFIGEAPAVVETRHLLPFVGPTGEEFTFQYLPLARVRRDDCYITNVVKCQGKGKTIPHDRVLTCAAHHLQREIEAIRPKHIVLMGASANLLRPGVSVELEHGRTVRGIVLGHACWVTCTLHPAAGLHNTRLIGAIREDFTRLNAMLRTSRNPWPSDTSTGYYHFAQATGQTPYCFVPPSDGGPIAIDTEILGLDPWHSDPWCLTFSTTPTRGYLIRAGDEMALDKMNKLIRGCSVVMQGAMFDTPPLARMGVDLTHSRIIDTQILAYARGYLGPDQSLKSLGYRLLGVRMQDFRELVRPYATEALTHYLSAARHLDYPEPGGRKRSIQSRIDRFVKDCRDKGQDALGKWGRWDDAIKAAIETATGLPAPKLTIDLVPFDKALDYACLDANVTRRLWQYFDTLQHDSSRPEFAIQRADVDLFT